MNQRLQFQSFLTYVRTHTSLEMHKYHTYPNLECPGTACSLISSVLLFCRSRKGCWKIKKATISQLLSDPSASPSTRTCMNKEVLYGSARESRGVGLCCIRPKQLSDCPDHCKLCFLPGSQHTGGNLPQRFGECQRSLADHVFALGRPSKGSRCNMQHATLE